MVNESLENAEYWSYVLDAALKRNGASVASNDVTDPPSHTRTIIFTDPDTGTRYNVTIRPEV